MTVFFTADTHFFHDNIIKYCNRPFKNINEMNEIIIENWNSVVAKDDLVYHLGDFALANGKGKFDRVAEIIDRLNGDIFLIEGNHDRIKKMPAWLKEKFAAIKRIHTIKIVDEDEINRKRHITLCHYAMRVWDGSYDGSWHFYGHSHGTLKNNGTLSIDVGVDIHNFKPISYEETKILIFKNFYC